MSKLSQKILNGLCNSTGGKMSPRIFMLNIKRYFYTNKLKATYLRTL